MAKFSNKSKVLLGQCDVRLQEVCEQAIEVMDFTIITGHRDKTAQDKAFADGNSKLIFPNSRHNIMPSQAIDIASYPVDWDDSARFILLAGVMISIANICGTNLRWGGDWNGDFNLKNNKFSDLGHFELVGDVSA